MACFERLPTRLNPRGERTCLSQALATRYAWPLSDAAPELLLPYAGRMRALHAKHPADCPRPSGAVKRH
jgi:hypothetical protein